MKTPLKTPQNPTAEICTLKKPGRPLSRRQFHALALLLPFSPPLLANSLKDSLSPYLAMHGNNPVDWHNWSKEVLQEAQQQNKLIFISSGYFACYWCHRMHEDVYAHPDAATVLNRHTLPVKIDRELNPALDAYLIEFAQRTTGRAGWPIHVLFTPEGLPFYSFLYQPKAQFIQTIERAAALWQRDPERIRSAAHKALPKPEPYPAQAHLKLTHQALQHAFVNALTAQLDDFSGGLKGPQKFPQSPLLLAALSLENLPQAVEDWLQLTLEQMAQHNLRDHLHGGFFRYTIDPEWHTPHYEKMLYDNAQLATLYLQAGKRHQRDDWVQVGLETLAFMDAHMRNPKTGLYYGSLSAVDRQRHEGGTYLWRQQQLQQVLPQGLYALVAKHWQLDQPGPWEGKWLPQPIEDPRWPEIKAALIRASQQPAHDEKQILAWNALVVESLMAAYHATGKPQWQQRAQALYRQLYRLLMETDSPPRALNEHGHPMGDATLEDHAMLKRAAQVLTQPEAAIQQRMEARYLTPFGWKLAASPLLPGMSGKKWLPDGYLPSATALTDQHAPQRLSAAQAKIQQNPLACGSYLRFSTLRHLRKT